jgi:hypothetical protein
VLAWQPKKVALIEDLLFPLDLNGNAMVIGGARKNYQVGMRGLVLTAH